MEKIKHLSADEKSRGKSLFSFNIQDNRSDKFLDSITELASKICKTPIALISLIDDNRQWCISKVGLKSSQLLSDNEFCKHTVRQKKLFVIHDAAGNTLFKESQFVKGEPKIRFYAGMPLTDSGGKNLGVLCVIDQEPKYISELQKSTLTVLSKSIISYLALRKNKIELTLAADDLNNLFINSPDLICTATPDGYFKKISSAFKTELGYSEAEMLSQPFINLVHPDDRDETLRVLGKLTKKGASVRFYRNRYRRKDGEYLWLSWNAISQQNNGQIIATARNITDKMQMEEEIRRLVEEEKKFNEDKIMQLSVLTSALSHEMLNPLNMILGFSGVTLELIDEAIGRQTDPAIKNTLEQVRTDILKIEEHARHMTHVVSNMSSINWNVDPASGNNPVKGKTFQINRVINECTKLAYSGFKQHYPDFSCDFNFNFDAKGPIGMLSVNDFSKSVSNIFYNAFEAILPKLSTLPNFTPKVTITTELSGQKIFIRIANNGISIPPENIKNLFNPFFTSKPFGQGLGLGLSISYNIIKMHHGTIQVEKSDAEETVFKITLPAGN